MILWLKAFHNKKLRNQNQITPKVIKPTLSESLENTEDRKNAFQRTY